MDAEMTDAEAIAEFERWFSYLKRQEERSVELQRLAVLAKTQPEEARLRARQLNSAPKVYDGANLYPAVRHAWRRLKEGGEG